MFKGVARVLDYRTQAGKQEKSEKVKKITMAGITIQRKRGSQELSE